MVVTIGGITTLPINAYKGPLGGTTEAFPVALFMDLPCVAQSAVIRGTIGLTLERHYLPW